MGGCMRLMHIKGATKVAPRSDVLQKSVEHLLLSIVVCVITWYFFSVGRTLRSASFFEWFCNARELVEIMRLDVNEFPETLACFRGLLIN